MIEIAYQENKFAQQRLSKAGGSILIKPNGVPVFHFKTKESFMKYCQLGKTREVVDHEGN